MTNKEGWEPALVLAFSHEDISFNKSSCSSVGKGDSHFRCGFGQHARCVTHSNTNFGSSCDINIVKTNGHVAVSIATGILQGSEELLTPLLSKLANNTITLGSNSLLNFGNREDISGGSNFNTEASICENLEPFGSRHLLGDDNSLASIWVEHLPIVASSVVVVAGSSSVSSKCGRIALQLLSQFLDGLFNSCKSILDVFHGGGVGETNVS
mmetsp:Transcript_9346/g.12886  ORF Transcript_9346/g.12886 Transcript_9346/m.12886 type:complete len:211 (+) Transcript_9346:722-1354(+)